MGLSVGSPVLAKSPSKSSVFSHTPNTVLLWAEGVARTEVVGQSRPSTSMKDGIKNCFGNWIDLIGVLD